MVVLELLLIIANTRRGIVTLTIRDERIGQWVSFRRTLQVMTLSVDYWQSVGNVKTLLIEGNLRLFNLGRRLLSANNYGLFRL